MNWGKYMVETVIIGGEGIFVKRLTLEQSQLFNMSPQYLNVGAFFNKTLVGFFSLGNYYGQMHLAVFHNIYYDLPFVARRMAKFVQSFGLASKCGFVLACYDKVLFEANKFQYQGIHYFTNYFTLQEFGNNELTKQFLLLPK